MKWGNIRPQERPALVPPAELPRPACLQEELEGVKESPGLPSLQQPPPEKGQVWKAPLVGLNHAFDVPDHLTGGRTVHGRYYPNTETMENAGILPDV